MLTNEQIDTIHRLHFVERWTIRKIAKHLHIGRRSIAKYLSKPVQTPLHRTRTSKLDSFKPAIEEWLQQDPSVTAAVIFQWLRDRGFAGGCTIVKDHLQNAARLRAYGACSGRAF
jgi:DNA-binding transcriptional regulator LsrR (DeoR family)